MNSSIVKMAYAKTRKLTKRQLRVLDDLFSDQFEEADVLKKHKVKNAAYKKWLLSDEFFEEFTKRACRKSKIMVAQYSQFATAKLIELAGCDKEEIARKACLDIVSLQTKMVEPAEKTEDENERADIALDPATASKILAVLAEKKG